MKLKNTLLLFLLFGGLFAFIWFFESKKMTTQETQESAGKLLSLDGDKVNRIQIRNSETKIEFAKDGKGTWRLEEPVKDRADAGAIQQLFTTAQSLRYDAKIGDDGRGPEKADLKEYGLSNADVRLKFIGMEKPVELLFGKDAAVEGKVYVKREDTGAAYVIPRDLKDQISKRVDDLRDRKLTELDAGRVERMTIRTQAGEIDLAKRDTHWAIEKPLTARGNASKITDLVSTAVAARVESFLADSTNLSAYGLQEPRATISLFTEGGKGPALLQLGDRPKGEADKDKTYAKLSTRDGVVLLGASVEALTKVAPNELRDRHLLQVEADIVDRIRVEGVGKPPIVLARNGESWVRKDGDKDVRTNVAAARQLLERLRNQEVTEFVSDVASDLQKYGLEQPQVRVTFSSYASENTSETKAGEKPIVTVLFGKVENGNVFAKLEEEPFVVSVPAAILETLAADPVQWQPLEIYDNSAEQISSLEILRNGQPAMTLERGSDNAWNLAKGDGVVNQTNVTSLLNTLSTLRAVRWVGAAQPNYGLEKPSLVVSFKTKGNAVGKLSLGGVTPEDVTYATAEGWQGVFGVSRPDASALQLSLIDNPPTPVPAAGPAPSVAVPPVSSSPPLPPEPASQPAASAQ